MGPSRAWLLVGPGRAGPGRAVVWSGRVGPGLTESGERERECEIVRVIL